MSASDRRPAAAPRRPGASSRLTRVWRGLPSERRLAAGASLALFLTLFLPWYQETVIAGGVDSLRSASASLTGWAAFSFVEAAVLLVAVSVLTLLFIRAEGGAFHVPGGDGGVITGAGVWTCALIVWRMFDKEGTSGHGQVATTSGIEWGIFIALAVAGLLTYAGTRIRRAHEPEPPLPGDVPTPSRKPEMEADDAWTQSPGPAPVRARRVVPADRNARMPADRNAPVPAGDERSRPAETPRRRVRPRSIGAGLDDLDLADPPASPLSRVEPSTIRLSGSEPETERIRQRPPDES